MKRKELYISLLILGTATVLMFGLYGSATPALDESTLHIIHSNDVEGYLEQCG